MCCRCRVDAFVQRAAEPPGRLRRRCRVATAGHANHLAPLTCSPLSLCSALRLFLRLCSLLSSLLLRPWTALAIRRRPFPSSQHHRCDLGFSTHRDLEIRRVDVSISSNISPTRVVGEGQRVDRTARWSRWPGGTFFEATGKTHFISRDRPPTNPTAVKAPLAALRVD